MTVESLKKEARRHEQREEWIKALDLYLQAIEEQAGEDEPDIALHNRVGDLQVRLGDLEGAIGNYERAITLYLVAELSNNAIAVCRKIIRHDPERPSPFLRMGQIRAQQGFIVDARQNFVTYAEMKQAGGDSEEAFRALEEFAALAPHDVETRFFLAERLVATERSADAIYYLSEAYRVVSDQGDADAAAEVLGRIHAIDPDHPVPTPAETDDESEQEPDFGFSGPGESEAVGPDDLEITSFGEQPGRDEDALGSVDDVQLDTETSGIDATPVPGGEQDDSAPSWDVDELEVTHLGGPGETPDDTRFDAGVVEGLEITGLAGIDETTSEPPVDEDSFDAEDGLELIGVDEEQLDDLPLIRYEPEEPVLEGAPGEEVVVLEEEAALEEDVPTLAAEEPAPEPALEEAQALPTISDEEDSEAGDPLIGLRARVDSEPDDAEGWRLLGEELFTRDQDEEGWQAMERAHQTYAENGDPEKAMSVVRELLLREPDRIELRQRVVEYAHLTNERTLLIQAFLELADGLRLQGQALKAEAVFEQVLAIDPSNLRANEALSGALPEMSLSPEVSEGDPVTKDEVGAESDGDYVDFGAMVLDPQGQETTRWTVAAEEPTGDEEEDFARMLSQFKENLAAFEMLGQCFLEKGEPEVAIRTLERGLELPTPVEDDLLGVYYWLGQAHEQVGGSASAREFYEKIFSLDINFKDVTERLKALR